MGSHQQVLALARQGNAQAIALLINQALVARGIQVRAMCQDSCLHVLLEAAQLPERSIYARVVYAAVLCLGVPTIRTVQVYGRQQTIHQPAWVQAFRLGLELGPSPQPAGMGQTAALTAGATALSSPTTLQRPKPLMRPAQKTSIPRLSVPAALSVFAASLGFGVGLTYLSHYEADSGLGTVSTPSKQPAAPQSSVSATSPTATPAAPAVVPVPSAQPTPAASEVALTIKAVGDMIPGSNFPSRALPSEPGEALAAERELLFGNIKPFFDESDILFGNFESTLTDYPHSAKDTSQNMTFAFRTPPAYAQMFKELGFDVLSVANNHSMDFGEQGFADTVTNIEQAGMKAVGQKGQIVYTTVNNIKVAFIGFSYLPYHNSMHDLATAGALVKEAKKQAKLVVISIHAGAEGSDQTHVRDRTEYFFGEDRGNLVNFAHGLIDQGADLILGHGPHVPRAVELYQGKLIAYSLGNFVGYRTLSTVGTLGYSLILKVQMNAAGDFVGGRVIPVALDKNGIPKLDDFFQSVILIRNLTKQDFPQTPLAIDDMGYILRTDR